MDIIKVPKKNGKKTIADREAILKQMQELYDKGKLGRYTIMNLAEMYNINKDTASNYRKKIYEENKKITLEDVQNFGLQMYSRISRRCEHWMTQAEEEQNVKAELAIQKRWEESMQSMTKFLEDYGYKQKATENVHVTADITQRGVNVQVVTNGSNQLEN